MTIYLPDNIKQLTEEEQEKMYWEVWKNNSHRWVEYHRGYYQCSYCEICSTNLMPASAFGLCKENPFLKELINEHSTNSTDC